MALHSKLLIMLPAAAGGVTARLAWTEADDAWAIVASAPIVATLAWTEADDTFSIAGNAKATASLAWTEADDAWAIVASAPIVATLAWTEADDTFSIAGNAKATASLAWTEADDTWAIAGAVTVTAALGWTEADDTFSIAGNAKATASLAWTEADDTWAIAGAVTVTAALGWTEADDTWAIAGAVTVTAEIAWAEADDSWALTAGLVQDFTQGVSRAVGFRPMRAGNALPHSVEVRVTVQSAAPTGAVQALTAASRTTISIWSATVTAEGNLAGDTAPGVAGTIRITSRSAKASAGVCTTTLGVTAPAEGYCAWAGGGGGVLAEGGEASAQAESALASGVQNPTDEELAAIIFASGLLTRKQAGIRGHETRH